MARILVAGAGHGGLSAALELARTGHSVAVLERHPELNLGYDWADMFDPPILAENGFSPPTADILAPAYWNMLIGPSKRGSKRPPDYNRREKNVDRRALLRLMIADCKEAGVEFRFNVNLLGPLVSGCRVMGLRTNCGDFLADLVIDAAGARSPIRENLAPEALVPRRHRPGQLLYVWRANYNRESNEQPKDVFKTYLYHRNRKGISWVAVNEDHVDVLLGDFTHPLSENEIADALMDLRADNPLLGKRLLRGGIPTVVSVRRPLGVMVTDGYAAVGDSACMSEPLSGSGINRAIEAGALLANVIAGCGDDFSIEKLWAYQYRYFMEPPPSEPQDSAPVEGRANIDVIKNFLLTFSPREIDLLFTRNIISVGLVYQGKPMEMKDSLKSLFRNLDHLPLLFKLVRTTVCGEELKKITRAIPETYNPDAVAAWAESYEGFERSIKHLS